MSEQCGRRRRSWENEAQQTERLREARVRKSLSSIRERAEPFCIHLCLAIVHVTQTRVAFYHPSSIDAMHMPGISI